MNMNLFKIFYLSLSMLTLSQMGHSAVIVQGNSLKNQDLSKIPGSTHAPAKTGSLIEKALNQRQSEKTTPSVDRSELDLKMLTSMRAAPTQNFLAAQNQHFSRLVQIIFPQQTS